MLTRDGESKIRIDTLCASLGVTKGSFYHHFENRDDFLDAIVDFWFEAFTRRVPELAGQGGADASTQLERVFEVVTREGLSQYDVAFEAWAAHEPRVLAKLKEVYRFRFDYIRSIFRELGFRGAELDLRTTALIAYLKADPWVTGKSDSKRSRSQREAQLAFFTRSLS